MEESLKALRIRLKARKILVSSSHNELAIVVDRLFLRKESEGYQTARALYDHCVANFPDCLALKLLQVYQPSSDGVTRFRSIYQLSETLTDLISSDDFKLSLDSLYEIKRALIPCLEMQETEESDIKILRRIVSCVAYNVVELHKEEWDELGDCILTLASSEPVNAFHVFVDLPTVYKGFINKFKHKILEEASKVFLDPYRVEHWSLALQTLVKMWIHLVNIGVRVELIVVLMDIQVPPFVSSVKKLVDKEKEHFLVKGLEDFERFFSRDMSLYHYTTDQCRFVSTLMSKIEGVGTHLTKEVVMRIQMLVTGQESPVIKPHDDDLNNRFDCGWNDHLKNLSSLEVLRIFAATELEDRSREIAIRRLKVLLSDHTSEKVEIDAAEIRELLPLLISCLKEGVSDSMFKVLAEVMDDVTYEMMICQDDECYELRDYIASSTTEFQRAVCIFQCLSVELVDADFLYPVMDKLFPEIMKGLEPPGELLVDNSFWVSAFTGGFCAAAHLIEGPGNSVVVSTIAHKMIDSVENLVERQMEVGLVRRAFRDVETIVKKQLVWYSTSEYKFLKALLWRLYSIEGMKWESKIVLWRINVVVERDVEEEKKELPKEGEFDWSNFTVEKVE
ncbi:PREDICTED: uncharacterized protein LOC104719357 [Camelina sativa]|uniref:Uncharacterized protein LOC104719357 n=1 Tax=Camelina sativa TaxID=90675 RepID=A0ABM1QIW0_CAMSA|nr:PREDICTED: uncharacterized protein LOC104719357 [Camelina sativa]